MRTYRVTVRGRFSNLTDEARASLLEDMPQHDASQMAFTTEGTFTYDAKLSAFSFRYEITDDAKEPSEADENASTKAELAAIELLEANGYGYTAIRVERTSIDDMQANTRRLQ